jgi:hypothetical protein
MRPSVATGFVAAWNAPVVYHFFRTDFQSDNSAFWRIVVIQIGWLVLACLFVAVSPMLHRLVFRADVPQRHFRGRLLAGAVLYALLGGMAWVALVVA